jgi:hypothetical protein
MKYKVGNSFELTSYNPRYVQNSVIQIVEIAKDSTMPYLAQWGDGNKIYYNNKELKKDFKQLNAPKKKKDKFKKRLKELEDEKEKVREFTFSMAGMFDELGKKVEGIEEMFGGLKKEQGERIVRAFTPALSKAETTEIAVEQATDEPLEKRIEALGGEDWGVSIDLNFHDSGVHLVQIDDSKGWASNIVSYGTDDQIVEKVKKIIEALKK